MGKSSRWNLWKQNRRSTSEGGNTKLLRNIQQGTKKHYKKGYPERKHKKMAKSIGGKNERCNYKIIFSKFKRRLAVNVYFKSKRNNNYD